MTQYTESWDNLPIGDELYAIILIDQRPALQRHRDAIKYKNKSLYVVLHDSEPEIDKFYAYRRVYPHFKFVYQYTKLKPNTAVLSNYYDPKNLFLY